MQLVFTADKIFYIKTMDNITFRSSFKTAGTTLFSADPNAAISDVAVRVRQGVREQSNVTPVDELVTMIVAMRYHEAAQRVLTSIDDAIANQTDPQG